MTRFTRIGLMMALMMTAAALVLTAGAGCNSNNGVTPDGAADTSGSAGDETAAITATAAASGTPCCESKPADYAHEQTNADAVTGGEDGSAAASTDQPKENIVTEQPKDDAGAAAGGNPRVKMETSKGDMIIELYPEEAPITVKNFLAYVDSGFYNDTIFHRVIADFMLQGGGFTKDMNQKPTMPPIKNEAKNGLKNERGTLSMARTAAVDSATSQFFVNLKHNEFLDHGVRDYGYAVFGKVVKGLDVVDAIGKVKTHNVGYFGDVPVEPVMIKKVTRLEAGQE